MLQPVILVQPGPDPVEQGFAGIGQAYAAATALKQLLAQLDELIAGSDKLPVMKRGELRGRISTKPGLNRYLRVTPGGLLRIDKAKIKAEANLDGKYLLRCSDPHLPAADIARGYKQLLEVERGWRDMKQIIETSVSFTKGCYVGQELVARIDSRGNNVPRRLRALITEQRVVVGDEVTTAGRPSSVTSSVDGTPHGAVALAYCGRDVEVGDVVDVAGIRAEVHALPLWGDGRG